MKPFYYNKTCHTLIISTHPLHSIYHKYSRSPSQNDININSAINYTKILRLLKSGYFSKIFTISEKYRLRYRKYLRRIHNATTIYKKSTLLLWNHFITIKHATFRDSYQIIFSKRKITIIIKTNKKFSTQKNKEDNIPGQHRPENTDNMRYIYTSNITLENCSGVLSKT